ncbi:MAG: Phage tail/DNA circulation protein [Herminiimonas sp.]|nr:Phage tail/DNA circulation protein [Herminiimonas sp.]
MTTANDFSAAARAAVAALASSTVNPADAVRLLSQLAIYSPTNATSTSPIGVAMGVMQAASNDLFRRAAVVALARASAKYQPFSVDDAARVRGIVCGALDSEISIAGDQHEDATFNALRSLRAAVVLDLTARGAGLPTIAQVGTPLPIPAIALAQQLYRDPSRADELVTQANCPHPAFMPVSFKALSQ